MIVLFVIVIEEAIDRIRYGKNVWQCVPGTEKIGHQDEFTGKI